MFVTVKLYDTLRRLSNSEDRGIWQGEVPDNCDIGQLIELIGSTRIEVAFAARNNKRISFSEMLVEDDVVALVTNVNGG